MTPGSALAASCRSVVQIYDTASGTVHALKGLTLDVRAGAVTAVVGPSGAGKSTLLRLLACLERPTVGEVTVGGKGTSRMSARARRHLSRTEVGYVFQSPRDNLFHDLSVRDHLRTAWRMRDPHSRPELETVLEQLDLQDVARARPADLSVGEQQRLSFAMAAAASPALVVADEPTASLDPASAQQLVGLLRRLAAEGQSMVISTHDPAVIDSADTVLVIRSGTLALEVVPGLGALSVLDDAYRLSLPPGTEQLFRERRAFVTAHDDHLRVDPP